MRLIPHKYRVACHSNQSDVECSLRLFNKESYAIISLNKKINTLDWEFEKKARINDMNDQVNAAGNDAGETKVKNSAKAQKRGFLEGAYIFREGETGDLAFVVLNGKVEISHVVDEKDVPIGVVNKGGMFGEMALIDNGQRMGSARAVEGAVETLVISREVFHKKLESADPFHRALIDILTSHIRGLADQLSKSDIRAS
jgi:CRP/FNR family transcriptional regulator, cyclic AMP receptor protein